MTDQTNDSLDAATELLRGARQLSPPTVEPLRSEVRSGENFLLTGGAAPANFVGKLIVEWGFEVSPGQVPQFHQFLAANEAAIHQESPDGVHYKGTYAVWAQSNMLLGNYRTIWAFDEIADLGKLAAAVAGNTAFGQLLKQLTAFRDTSIGASRSQQMYQVAASAQQA
jgi:hypothetical protein